MSVLSVEELNDGKEASKKFLSNIKGQVKDSSDKIFDEIMSGQRETPEMVDILKDKSFVHFCKRFGNLMVDYSFDFIDEAIDALHKKAVQNVYEERNTSSLH